MCCFNTFLQDDVVQAEKAASGCSVASVAEYIRRNTMNKKELFIVEGKSAHSALKQAIDRKSQSVYALQGKLANVNKMSNDAVADNLACRQLIVELGGDFTSEIEIGNLPYSRVLIVMDPDIDGSHSRALVLTFFARFCKPIVDSGLLSVIKAPMFRVDGQGVEPLYAWSEEELAQVLSASGAGKAVQTTRYKGVAQFSVDECYRFLLDPATRQEVGLT